MKKFLIILLSLLGTGCSVKDKAEEIATGGTITVLAPPGGLDNLTSSSSSAALADDEYELKSLIFNLTELSVGLEEGEAVTWETVFAREKEDAVSFDLLKGDGDDQLVPGVNPGNYKFVKLKFSSIEYQRGENEECSLNTLTGDEGAGILTTQEEFESRGQTIDDTTGISPPDEGKGPSDLDSTIDDGYFWILTSEVNVLAGSNTSLIVTALADPTYTAAAPCDEAPGTPNFILGTSDSIISFYDNYNQ